jgi:flavin-dependent dehydrogenase
MPTTTPIIPPMRHAWDIIIIGGGPAGSTAAALLAQQSRAAGHPLSIALFEGKSFPREKVCGEFMGTRLRPVLRRLNLLEEFDRRAGPPITRVVAHSGQTSIVGELPSDADGAWPRAVSRADLDAMLLQRAADSGATVFQSCHVSEITGNADEGFVVSTPHGKIHARTVILAHGLAQRPSLAPDETTSPLRREYISYKAHFANSFLPENAIAIGGAHGIYAGLVKSNGDRSSLAFVIRRSRAKRFGPSGDAQLAALLRENAGFSGMLRSAPQITPWMTSGPLEPGIRTQYHDGRFFVGNAAGEVHALVGEGITLAMRSAALLADTLIQTGLTNLHRAGALYTHAWRKQFIPRYAAAQLFANLMMRPALAAFTGSFLDTYPEAFAACIRSAGK